MNPDRLVLPLGARRAASHTAGCRLAVDRRAQRRNPGARLLVPPRQRLAPERVVPARRRSAGGIDPLQRGDELREVGRKAHGVRDRRDIAVSPSSHS